jgi:hypothetical protein
MRRFRALWALLTLLPLLVPQPARAQFFGLGDLLNPEGSRLFPQTYLFPRHPGKPDPRWKSFRWQFVNRKVEGSNYRLFFDRDAHWTAELVAPRVDGQVLELSKTFGLTLPKTFDYVLFNSERAFQQANIFDISEGVQGITSTTEASMAIPYWGELATFDHISTHEMVHQFQVQKIEKIGGYYAMDSERLFPLWFIEGMAEFYSLHGMDAKSSFYLRDLLVHANPKEKYKAPKFFEDGPLNFIGVYKLGQARCDFLDQTFGTGTVQRLLEKGAKRLGQERITFQTLVTSELKVPADQVEKKWQDYLATYKKQADSLKQDAGKFGEVKGVGNELDSFALSPDGKLLAAREIDALTGRTYLRVMDLAHPGRKLDVVKDATDGILSLQFMEYPIIALGNDLIAYTLSTTAGPAIEYRAIRRSRDGKISLGGRKRIELQSNGLIQISYPALSPDEKEIAFVGLDAESKANVYRVKLESKPSKRDFRALTAGYYSWKSLSWGSDGILAVWSRARSPASLRSTRTRMPRAKPQPGCSIRLGRPPDPRPLAPHRRICAAEPRSFSSPRSKPSSSRPSFAIKISTRSRFEAGATSL